MYNRKTVADSSIWVIWPFRLFILLDYLGPLFYIRADARRLIEEEMSALCGCYLTFFFFFFFWPHCSACGILALGLNPWPLQWSLTESLGKSLLDFHNLAFIDILVIIIAAVYISVPGIVISILSCISFNPLHGSVSQE